MATVTFDTLKFTKKLEAAGVEPAQAEAMAEAFSEATSQELVTRDYLDIKLADLRMELREMKVDIIKWMTGALIAQAAVIATLVKLL